MKSKEKTKEQLDEKSTQAGRQQIVELKSPRNGRKLAEDVLAEELNLLRTLIDNIPDRIYFKDDKGRFLAGNIAVAHQMGAKTPDELIGKTDFDFYPRELAQQFYADEQQIILSGQPLINREKRIVNQTTGEHLWFSTSKIPLRDSYGKIVGIVGIDRDITKCIQSHLVVQESQRLQKAILDTIPDMAWLKDKQSRFIAANERFSEACGIARADDLVGKTDLDIWPKDLAKRYRADDRKVMETGRRKCVVEPLEETDGTRIWIETFKTPIYDDNGQVIGTSGIARDITKRMQAEKKLLDYQAQLKSMTSELFLTEERQRQRLAAGVHDNIGQGLILAKLTLQSLMESESDSAISASLNKVCAAIDQAIEDTNSLTFELGSPVLYELGFEAAVEQLLAEQIQTRHGIKCKLTVDSQPLELDNEISIVLFRSIRELLINVVKHAKAKTVAVHIQKTADRIQVAVEDDGIGFEPSEIRFSSSQNKTGGFGLFSIRERLEYLGWEMKIKSAPAKGSCITLTGPVKRQK